jgi:hypothetical protein
MMILDLSSNQLNGKPPFASAASFGTGSIRRLVIRPSTCAARVDPHPVRQAHQHAATLSLQQPTDRCAPVSSFYPVSYTSPPNAEVHLSLALAGSIPTELGELVNLTNLRLGINELTGTHPFVDAAWFGTTSLPLAEKTFHLRLQVQSPPNSASSST